jgi:hypothetical protein
MIRINIKNCIYFFAVAIFISACDGLAGDEYTRLVKRELAKGKRVDSLFLGISFGMTSKTFYGYCWELNKKGIITDGANNTMVLYQIDSALKYPATMDFYPDFYENKIYHMRVIFQYNAWAPWNKAQSADSLLPDVIRLYKKWYQGSNEFMKITDKVKGTIYVKVDANRRITVGKYDDAQVHVDYTDLLVEKKLKKAE